MYKYLFALMAIFICVVLIQFQGCGVMDRIQERRWKRQEHREEHREERKEEWRRGERGFRGLVNRFRERQD